MTAVHVWEDVTPAGTVYRPGDAAAQQIAELARAPGFTADMLTGLRLLGFEVVLLSDRPRPLPHPWAGYRRKVSPEPRHVLDEA